MSGTNLKKNFTSNKKMIYGLIALIGIVLVAVFGLGLFGNQSAEQEVAYQTATAKEGSLKSSTLLTGKVKATEEQYVYYDANKGDLSSVAVNVGDQVQVGQVLASYDATDAQRSYDSAVRALNKVDRQINELKTTGQISGAPYNNASSAGSSAASEEASGETTGGAATASANTNSGYSSQGSGSINSQLKDLNDSRADAADAVNKAKEALDATNETSKVNGTVVEVNRDMSKGNTTTAQTVVHVVNNGSLIIEGEMSEYNLANIAVNQEVTITSKVYPDQTWTGKVKSISDYPGSASGAGDQAAASAATAGSSGGSGGSSSKYPFKIDLVSALGKLKQGFTVNVEVNSDKKGLLVPVKSIVEEGGKNYVYTYNSKGKTVKRAEVKIGSADGANQQIASGLKSGDTVIANPGKDLKDGQEVTVDGKKAD